MADTSPGKVQALRAMFAQQDSVIGLLPQTNGKIAPRPWKRSMSSLSSDVSEQPVQEERIEQQQVTALNQQNARALLRIIQDERDSQFEAKSKINGVGLNPSVKAPHKPVIGPKPLFAKQPSRTSPTAVPNQSQRQELGPATCVNKTTPKTVPPKPKRNNPQSRKLDETSLSKCIESFMFHHHAYSNGCVISDRDRAVNNNHTLADSSSPSGDAYSNKSQSIDRDSAGLDLSSKIANDAKAISQLSLINSDNYICKSNCKLVRNKLPPKDKLGPAPLKPSKPHHLKLPQSLRSCEKVITNGSDPPARTVLNTSNSSVHQVAATTAHVQPKLPSSCPPRPTTAPPVPPCSTPSPISSQPSRFPARTPPGISTEKSLVEEMEELYEDTLLGKNGDRNFTLITDYLGKNCDNEELYDDAVENEEEDDVPPPCPPKPRNPPPPPPSSLYLDPIGNPVSEELYQDAAEASDCEFYEEMPSDFIEENHYINNRKELEKLRREKEKRLRKESKEKEKKEKEMEKVKKKFGLLGDEIPIDAGVVKSDSRGGRCDLPVSRGEKVYILRIEGNPAGKWLVRNKKGKYGYVELTNIEVDPDSVKSSSGSSEESLENTTDEQKTETWLSKFTACVRQVVCFRDNMI